MSAEAASPLAKTERGLWTWWMLGPRLVRLDDWPRDDHVQGLPSTIARLNWSIEWHTLASRQAMRWYNSLKVAQISAAATIPILTATGGNSPGTKWVIAGLGALIVILEGIQQLKKYGQNGLLWAQGKEALKREYYLYQAQVPPYDKSNAQQSLARRIEQIIGKEVGNWADQDQDNADHADDSGHSDDGGHAGDGGKPKQPGQP